LRVPARHVDGGSMGFIGMASGMAWMPAIFKGMLRVERFG
jgi:hypothetical protein